MDLQELKKETQKISLDIIERSQIRSGQLFVLGLSSSEILGHHIGTTSSLEIGEVVVKELLDTLSEKGIYLAVQGCEHINRALVVEREFAEKHNLEIVSVLPTLHAGGSGQMAAFKYMKDPVEVEHVVAFAGLDIGDTSIGMHIKHVQVPLRPVMKELGKAHVTALSSRPKLIGGQRAQYAKDPIRKF
ncbi:TIGR01440 family protein [Streptococcus zalophi]|uniref:UPF0340 protein JHK64_04780 n=1 Tax=Streptococcus zalophi TaxID=640031 RepID=A0A934PAH7_9STRE|nr:TIGR01440 family protein [Streptococcus zalophi]MBJ8349943.1 TIGR01440 family protein [Streptococcus zalophi]MCR8966938.1 TIGR01440 family protein [Streptococcus zalophi]